MKYEHPLSLKYYTNENIRIEYMRRILEARANNICYHCGNKITKNEPCPAYLKLSHTTIERKHVVAKENTSKLRKNDWRLNGS